MMARLMRVRAKRLKEQRIKKARSRAGNINGNVRGGSDDKGGDGGEIYARVVVVITMMSHALSQAHWYSCISLKLRTHMHTTYICIHMCMQYHTHSLNYSLTSQLMVSSSFA